MLAVVLVACFVALVVYVVAGAVATVTTIRSARSDDRLSADLDHVLAEILGPRSDSAHVN